MSFEHLRSASEAVLNSMTEEDFANCYRQQGTRIIQHQGHYWKETVPGFYQPLHWLARLSAKEATYPTPLSWGLRATLSDTDAAAANGSMPVHLLSNFENYASECLSANRRHHLRQCQKKVKIFQLMHPALLEEQGYEVVLSAKKRTQYSTVPSKTDYLASLSNYSDPKRRLVFVGLIGEKLGGYIAGYAINGTAYFEDLYIATEALTTNLNLGLVFEFVQACHRSGTISELINGQHSIEDEKLCIFKDAIGFPVKYIPVKVQMNTLIEKIICWRYPYKYYRLTGRNNHLIEANSQEIVFFGKFLDRQSQTMHLLPSTKI
jgi:hypothetical protein